MKAKALVTVALAAAMVSASALSVSAGTLSNENPWGETEVIARIDGNSSGEVTYTIIIPDVIDFGTLEQPQINEDQYKDVGFTVKTGNTVEGLTPSQSIMLYVRDKTASVNGSNDFVIANKVDPTKTFKYDVYVDSALNININSNAMTSTRGYKFTNFTIANEEVQGTLRLNEHQLYGKDISELVGEYSGYMIFFSQIEGA